MMIGSLKVVMKTISWDIKIHLGIEMIKSSFQLVVNSNGFEFGYYVLAI